MKFIKLTAKNNLDAIINADKIQCVTDAISHSTIFFAEDDFLEVLEGVEMIYKMLEDNAK